MPVIEQVFKCQLFHEIIRTGVKGAGQTVTDTLKQDETQKRCMDPQHHSKHMNRNDQELQDNETTAGNETASFSETQMKIFKKQIH